MKINKQKNKIHYINQTNKKLINLFIFLITLSSFSFSTKLKNKNSQFSLPSQVEKVNYFPRSINNNFNTSPFHKLNSLPRSLIPQNNFKEIPLSESLFEEDPMRKLKIKDFSRDVKFGLYKLSLGEIQQIFYFVDTNKDDLIDIREWESFVNLFILPFEQCDVSKNYLLSPIEFKNCFEKDKNSKLIQFTDSIDPIKHKLIMDIVSTRKDCKINFSDYLIIRRALFGWKECQSNGAFISVSPFKCALKASFPERYHMKFELDSIYNAGLKVINDPAAQELEFVSYLRVLYFTYIFSILSSPQDSPFLEYSQFLSGIKEDRFPTGIIEKEVDYIYDMINSHPIPKKTPLNFESFCIIFNAHRLFSRYALTSNFKISEKELNCLLNDYSFPTMIKLSIDSSITNFSAESYAEGSMVLQRVDNNERDFYYSFKSVSSKLNSNNSNNSNNNFNKKKSLFDKVNFSTDEEMNMGLNLRNKYRERKKIRKNKLNKLRKKSNNNNNLINENDNDNENDNINYIDVKEKMKSLFEDKEKEKDFYNDKKSNKDNDNSNQNLNKEKHISNSKKNRENNDIEKEKEQNKKSKDDEKQNEDKDKDNNNNNNEKDNHKAEKGENKTQSRKELKEDESKDSTEKGSFSDNQNPKNQKSSFNPTLKREIKSTREETEENFTNKNKSKKPKISESNNSGSTGLWTMPIKVNVISSNNPNLISLESPISFNTVSRNFKKNETSIISDSNSPNIIPNYKYSNGRIFSTNLNFNKDPRNLGNLAARHFFYTTISSAGKMSLNKFDFYFAILSSNIFTEIIKDDENYLASVSDIIDKLPKIYIEINPSVNLEQRDNYLIWRMIPKEGRCDLLSFLAVEFHKKKLELKKINRQQIVSENLLRNTFEDYGWRNLPGTVLSLAKRGFDRLRKRQFSGPEAFRYALITHIATSQNERGKIFDKKFELDLKVNSFKKFEPIGKKFAYTS